MVIYIKDVTALSATQQNTAVLCTLVKLLTLETLQPQLSTGIRTTA